MDDGPYRKTPLGTLVSVGTVCISWVDMSIIYRRFKQATVVAIAEPLCSGLIPLR
jgi:hypothetical protein